jgi:putative glutamine amidotransferase
MNPPLILTSPSTQQNGVEFADNSISISNQYGLAVAAAGGLPWISPCIATEEFVVSAVQRCDGVLLTGGDDIHPDLYAKGLPKKLRDTVAGTDVVRDLFELMLIDEVFRQRKPLLAICRGHQLLNVAFGGTLVVDIPTELPEAINHKRMDRKSDVVHEAELTPGSMIARLLGKLELGVNSSHHQAVGRIAAPFKATARSSDGVVEAMELEPETVPLVPFLLSVQFHPERLFDRYAGHLALFRAFVQAAASGKKL